MSTPEEPGMSESNEYEADAKRKMGWFLTELDSVYSPVKLDVRADNAFGVAVKFFSLIEEMVSDPEDQRKLMSAWFKAVRDRDFKKFKRALRRYDRAQNGETPDPEDAEI